MYSNQFYKTLETILIKSFSDINHVNSGGCGWAALVMTKALRRAGIKAEIYFCNYYKTDTLMRLYGGNFVNILNNAIESNDPFNIPNRHLLIKVGNYYFDSTGEVNSKDVDPRTKTPLYLIPKILKVAQWNNCFEVTNNNLYFKQSAVQDRLYQKLEQLRECIQ